MAFSVRRWAAALTTLLLACGPFLAPSTARAHQLAAPANTLTAAFDADFSTLDPAIGYDAFSWTGEHAIFNALLGYANAPGRAGTHLVPDLATSMPAVTNRSRIYTFHLRRGVRFSPPVNREVTASDFQYSIERALAKGTNGPM